jgi:putative alpha-1,2-mannosidase
LGSPLFERIKIKLSDKYYSGKYFVISTEGQADDAPYVQEYRLNGKKLTAPHISFADVVNGGALKIKLGSNPVDKY